MKAPALLALALLAIWPFSTAKWQWSTRTVNFGVHPVGTLAVPFEIQLSNTGSKVLSVTLKSVEGSSFGAQGPTADYQLATGKTASFQVEFNPREPGIVGGKLNVAINGKVDTIELQGVGK